MKTNCAFILTCLCLANAAPARADAEPENTRSACTDGRDNDGDGHVDCADQDCQDFNFCAPVAARGGPPDDLARLRGRGTTRVIVGAVLLSLGVLFGATSAAVWVVTDYGLIAGLPMDVLGLGLIAGGTALLAMGGGDLATARRPKVAFGLTSFSVRF